MTRLPFLLFMASVGFPIHPIDIPPSLLPGEMTASSSAGFEAPELQSEPECPVANCLVQPVSLTRGTRVPAKAVSEFTVQTVSAFSAGQEPKVELAIATSDRKRTTIKAWLNGELVLLPSAFPRAGTDTIRIPVTLAEQNVLEFRLTAKPGTEVEFWIESPGAPPPEPEDPVSTFEFRLSKGTVGPDAIMNEVCSTDHGADFQIAEWSDVVDGLDPSPIWQAGSAWVQWNGLGSFSLFTFGPTYHYLVSAIGPENGTVDSLTSGGDTFWLTSGAGYRRVLCKGPKSS